MPTEKRFSFAEIVQGRDASVRVTDDKLLSAVDLVTLMTGKNVNHANECLRDLNQSLFDNENFIIRSRSRYVSFEHALELIMVLPGKVAKETRIKFADIIRRYIAGDKSLICEIETNAKSNDQIALMAKKGSLSTEEESMMLVRKRKFEEMELAKLDQDYKFRELEIKAKEEEIKAREIANQSAILSNKSTEIAIRDTEYSLMSKVTSSYRELCQDTVIDGRARLILKDNFLNIALLNNLEKKSTKEEEDDALQKPISLSMVASDMHIKLSKEESISIGIELKKRYVAKYGKNPDKHEQLCDGRVTKVNSYMASDRPMMEEVLRWHAQGRPKAQSL
jgi:hypothetical protein